MDKDVWTEWGQQGKIWSKGYFKCYRKTGPYQINYNGEKVWGESINNAWNRNSGPWLINPNGSKAWNELNQAAL